jgi:hypothetical protein
MARVSTLGLLCVLLFVSGCNRGYQSAGDLEHAERGPTYCAKSCQELGMRMSAFVLVESNIAGCVCEPMMQPAPGPYAVPPSPPMSAPPPQPQSRRSASGAAAGWLVVELQRQRAAQQAQQAAIQPK